MSLILKDNSRQITLDRGQALALELKFNLTPYGKPWKHIGDTLYYFFRSDGHTNVESIVSAEQLDILNNLLPTSQLTPQIPNMMSQRGGSNNSYHKKYLKYKLKYLELQH